MSRLTKAAFLAATLFACFAASPAAVADSDSTWVQQTIASSKSAADPSIKTALRRRTIATQSGLARIESDTPAHNHGHANHGHSHKLAPRAAKSVNSVCIPTQLRGVLNDVAAQYGSISITSTCRTASANRDAGGAPRSLHLYGQAVDFRVAGSPSAVMKFLRANSDVGGLKHYGGGLFHIDTGPRRFF